MIRTNRLLKRLMIPAMAAGLAAATQAVADDALFVDQTGNVGIGTNSPTRALSVIRDGGGSESQPLVLRNPSGKVRFLLTAGSETWTFDNTGADSFTISKVGTGAAEMSVAGNGNMTIRGTLTEGSSREIKTEVEQVEHGRILEELEGLPISEWSYEGSDSARHIGPMAEEFYAAFGLGSDAEHVAPRDLAGVAMASVKALSDRLEVKRERVAVLEEKLTEQKKQLMARNRELQARVDELAAMVGRLATEVETGKDGSPVARIDR